jgi:lipopolysaccharide transport system ATP-binding protein
MSRPAIEVSGLSKRYVIEHESRHDNLRDTLHHTARKLWRRFRWGTGFAKEEFWALRDVSFSVQPGEVVGIIGRNGAGKSTLLKILSRITEATSGKVTLRGRVASLLEVGTGFHPDLTGRENIYLNGAILGMSRAEIREKFDEIVAFAEIERFLDTPVKRYSSGMYVRLAFAVAAHLEPEILVVDEVLAVGDASFQKKCLGKMQSVAATQGRTVLFVSHNMAAVQHLCSRGIMLRQGSIAHSGDIGKTVAAYLRDASDANGRAPWHYRHSTPGFRVTRVELRSGSQPVECIIAGQPLTLLASYECTDPGRYSNGLGFSLTLKCEERKITNLWSEYQPNLHLVPAFRGTIECEIPQWPFREASFSVDCYTHAGNEPVEWIEGCLVFASHDGDFFGSGRLTNRGEGDVFVSHRWKTTCL